MNPRIAHLGPTLALALLAGCADDLGTDEPGLKDDEADVAVVESALSKFQTLTSLNLGQNLASNTSGSLVVTAPKPSDKQQGWELLFPGSAGSSEPGFGSAFQLRNQSTRKCAEDKGLDLPIAETTCLASPGPNSRQLWQQHVAVDRVAHGQNYFFLFNRGSDRVLSRAPQFGSVPALSSKKATNNQSAAAALQQWTFQRL